MGTYRNLVTIVKGNILTRSFFDLVEMMSVMHLMLAERTLFSNVWVLIQCPSTGFSTYESVDKR